MLGNDENNKTVSSAIRAKFQFMACGLVPLVEWLKRKQPPAVENEPQKKVFCRLSEVLNLTGRLIFICAEFYATRYCQRLLKTNIMKIFYLFGRQVVDSYNETGGVNEIISDEIPHAISFFDMSDPRPWDLLESYTGWDDFTSITESDFDLLANVNP